MVTLLTLLACTGTKPIVLDTADDTDVADTDTDSDSDTDDTGDGPLGDPALLCQIELSCPDGIEDEPKRACDLRIVSGDGAGVYDAMAMVEIRGRSSAHFVKPPYAVELHAEAAYLVPPRATWRYLDGAAAPAAGWERPGFDDTAWSRGPAPLGYGDDPATALDDGDTGGGRAPAAWFRATFEVDDPAAIAELELGLVRDDAAVVWLNGTEVVRSNLAASAGPADWALASVQDEFESEWTDWALSPSLLVAGTNTLAVEVHQSDASSSDLRFDASLLASGGRLTPHLFGMGGEDDWVLGSAYIDRVLWRNKLAYDLFQSFGEGTERWAPEQVFCELTLDGDYRGVYLLGEPVRRDADRLDLSDDDASFIVKLAEEGGFTDNLVGYGEWQAVYPKQTEANAARLTGVDATLTAWQQALLAGDESQWDHLDLDSAVDWVIVEELFKNSDAYYLSVHLWSDAGSPMRMAPWDFDLSLGYPYTDCGTTGFVWRNELPDGFAGSPAFKSRLVERWAELRDGPLADDVILSRIAAYEATLGDAIPRNFDRWPVDEIMFGWGDEDNWLCPAETWEEEHDRVMGWIPERTGWLDLYFADY